MDPSLKVSSDKGDRLCKNADVNAYDESGRTALHIAVDDRRVHVLKLLLAHSKIDVNASDKRGRTALHIAVTGGRMHVLKLLLQHSEIDVNASDEIGRTALHEAANGGHMDALKLLLEHSTIDVNAQDYCSQPALHIAVTGGRMDVLKLLLAHSEININIQGRWNGAITAIALHLAIDGGHMDALKLLLAHPTINVNVPDPRKERTVLHLAIDGGHMDAIKLLLVHSKIDVNAYDGYRQTALHMAVVDMMNEKEWLANAVDLLVAHPSININACDEDDETPLHLAASHANMYALKLLLAKTDIKVNAQDKEGESALHCAFLGHSNRGNVVQCLLDNGADVSIRDANGWLVIHHLIEKGYIDCFQAVVERILRDINQPTNDDEKLTPLMLASKHGQFRAARLLLDNGADVSITDANGWSLLHHLVTKLNDVEKDKTDYRPCYKVCFKGVLRQGAGDINQPTSDGEKLTPLMLASKRDQLLAVQWLLDNGADVSITDANGWSVIHHLVTTDFIDCLTNVVGRGSGDINQRTSDGKLTPLMLACNHDQLRTVQWLLMSGADISEADMKDLTKKVGSGGNSGECLRVLRKHIGDPVFLCQEAILECEEPSPRKISREGYEHFMRRFDYNLRRRREQITRFVSKNVGRDEQLEQLKQEYGETIVRVINMFHDQSADYERYAGEDRCAVNGLTVDKDEKKQLEPEFERRVELLALIDDFKPYSRKGYERFMRMLHEKLYRLRNQITCFALTYKDQDVQLETLKRKYGEAVVSGINGFRDKRDYYEGHAREDIRAVNSLIIDKGNKKQIELERRVALLEVLDDFNSGYLLRSQKTHKQHPSGNRKNINHTTIEFILTRPEHDICINVSFLLALLQRAQSGSADTDLLDELNQYCGSMFKQQPAFKKQPPQYRLTHDVDAESLTAKYTGNASQCNRQNTIACLLLLNYLWYKNTSDLKYEYLDSIYLALMWSACNDVTRTLIEKDNPDFAQKILLSWVFSSKQENPESAFKELLDDAHRQDVERACQLAMMYREKFKQTKKFQHLFAALEWCNNALALNPLAAIRIKLISQKKDYEFQIGLRYYHGSGVEKNDEKAFKHFTAASTQGRFQAMLMLGKMHEEGRGCDTVDEEKAIELYRKVVDILKSHRYPEPENEKAQDLISRIQVYISQIESKRSGIGHIGGPVP